MKMYRPYAVLTAIGLALAGGFGAGAASASAAPVTALAAAKSDPRHQLNEDATFALDWQRTPLIQTRNQFSTTAPYWTLAAAPADVKYGLCKDENHRQEPVVDLPCAGIVLTPRTVLTARHCIGDAQPADVFAVFGFRSFHGGVIPVTFTDASVIGVAKTWSPAAYTSAGSANDWVALELTSDAPATYPPARLRLTSNPPFWSVLYVLGYPAGLPAKFTRQGRRIRGRAAQGVRAFRAELPAYSGTSGGPVVAGDLVYGMLVSADRFTYESLGTCASRKLRPSNSASERDEQVLRLGPILHDLNAMRAAQAAPAQSPAKAESPPNVKGR